VTARPSGDLGCRIVKKLNRPPGHHAAWTPTFFFLLKASLDRFENLSLTAQTELL
jgi:hypothetical protein